MEKVMTPDNDRTTLSDPSLAFTSTHCSVKSTYYGSLGQYRWESCASLCVYHRRLYKDFLCLVKKNALGTSWSSAFSNRSSCIIGDMHTEVVQPRSGLPPLLQRLEERKPENLQWLGVSYGLTQQLFTFWKRSGFHPVYLRQGPSDVTGRHLTPFFCVLWLHVW